MSNSEVATSLRARMALVLVGLAWVLPFLSPNFLEPIASFYGEVAAMVLGLAALTCLYSRATWPNVQIPRASLMFLGFAGLILCTLRWAARFIPSKTCSRSCISSGQSGSLHSAGVLREIFGLETVAITLSWFVLTGALLSAAIGLMQWWGIPSPLKPFMLPQIHARIYANTGQPNHLADYICLGIASLIFLSGSGRLRLPMTALAATPLLLVLVVSGSRSIWLYLAALLILAAMHWLLRRSRTALRIVCLSLAIFAGFVLAQWLISMTADSPGLQIESITGRVHSEGVLSKIRLRLWHEAWLMLRDAPLLGQGFRQFAWQHFLLNAQLPGTRLQDVLYDNAHNLVFQTGAEFGLAGLLMLGCGAWVWARAVTNHEFSAAMWWVLSAAAILCIHSMLEYPLWYAYFLGIGAVLLGASESAATTIGNRTGGRLVPGLILLLGWMAAANTYQDYRTLQSLHRVQSRAVADGRSTTEVLLELQQHSLFTPFVELALSRLIALNRERLADKVAVNEAAMHYAPAADVVYRQAILLALMGRRMRRTSNGTGRWRTIPETGREYSTCWRGCPPAMQWQRNFSTMPGRNAPETERECELLVEQRMAGPRGRSERGHFVVAVDQSAFERCA
jgi:O-antigen ligase